jgi:hypothetical protein
MEVWGSVQVHFVPLPFESPDSVGDGNNCVKSSPQLMLSKNNSISSKENISSGLSGVLFACHAEY